MTTHKKVFLSLAGASALALTLAACGGDSSSDGTPGGGGAAVCDESTMENLAKGAAGDSFTSFNGYECADGFALVTAITTDNDIEQTQVYLFQAEGSNWALQQRDAVCADGADVSGIPANYLETLCALR